MLEVHVVTEGSGSGRRALIVNMFSLSIHFSFCLCCGLCVNIRARVLDHHGEVLKRRQLMGNQRKQRPWHCGTRWRLTLLSHTHECGEAAACYFEPSCHQSAYDYRDTLGAAGESLMMSRLPAGRLWVTRKHPLRDTRPSARSAESCTVALNSWSHFWTVNYCTSSVRCFGLWAGAGFPSKCLKLSQKESWRTWGRDTAEVEGQVVFS